jgi:hypothetical protein
MRSVVQPGRHHGARRLVACGLLSEMLAFELKAGSWLSRACRTTSPDACDRVRTITPLTHARFMLDLPPEAEPRRLIGELRATGAQLESLNPVRETLEDYFVQHVSAAKPARRVTMRRSWLIAGAVFTESVRDRVPYAMVVFAVLLIAASYLIGQLTAGQDMKTIKDLGLAALSIFGLFIAVFIGIGLVSKEVERKSVFGLLDKPRSRTQFLLGKYAGLVMTLRRQLSGHDDRASTRCFYMNCDDAAAAFGGVASPAIDPRMLMRSC